MIIFPGLSLLSCRKTFSGKALESPRRVCVTTFKNKLLRFQDRLIVESSASCFCQDQPDLNMHEQSFIPDERRQKCGAEIALPPGDVRMGSAKGLGCRTLW